MRAAVKCFEAALATDAGVLIFGEPGTGRELMARAIHRASSEQQVLTTEQLLRESTRSFVGGRPFVTVDCAATPDLEALLFGHRQARESGAEGIDSVSHDSQLHRALGGTLFLRQLQEMPSRQQTRLARMLREREVWVEDGQGTGKLAPVCARVIGALDGLPDDGADSRVVPELRRRLSATPIQLPPLRERREDIPGLVRQLLEDLCVSMRLRPKATSRQADELLSALPWRGNVRELRALLRAVVVRVPNRLVRLHDVLKNVQLDGTVMVVAGGGTLKEARERFEREYVAAVLQQHRGRMADAAVILGIQRTNLYRKVRRLCVERPVVTRPQRQSRRED